MGLFPASLLGVEGALLPSRALFHNPDGLPEPRDNGKGRWEWAPGVGSAAGWRLWVFLQRDSLEARSSKGIPWKHTVPKEFPGNTSFLLSCGCLSKGIPWKHTIPAFLWVFVQRDSLEAHTSRGILWKHTIPQGFHGSTQFPLSCGCLSKGIPWKHTIPAFLCVFLQSNSLEAHNSKEIPWKHIILQGFHGNTQFPLSCGCLSKGIHWKHTIPEGFHGSTQFHRDSMETHNPLFRFNLVPPPPVPGYSLASRNPTKTWNSVLPELYLPLIRIKAQLPKEFCSRGGRGASCSGVLLGARLLFPGKLRLEWANLNFPLEFPACPKLRLEWGKPELLPPGIPSLPQAEAGMGQT
ncbi:uncharacterized protein LOC121660919 isoform X2 [Corvus kubaryi]|uniref:uncharacterized protein LOC121660919 isoform X2 n=1 Tax=Corvus kubaryi TaxID=68294 RepID=UPI001C049700|nr:uncharacterized protein LOC121660919 isoform X2 [Corvus kubaryi]